MNWLNLQVSVVRAPEYVSSEPVQRATWFNVLAYSAERENGGRIEGAKNWKDRQWQQTCGVTLAEVEAAAPLLTWEGNDLLVWSYPTDKQAEIQAKRKAGQESGRKRAAQSEAHSDPSSPTVNSSAISSASSSASTEGKGREVEGEREIEGEGNTPPKAPQSSAAPPRAGKQSKLPESDQAKRLAGMVHRKLTTEWTDKEIKAYRKLGTLPDDDLGALEKYYGDHWPPNRETNILRHDLFTLLNNFQSEVDRAHAYALPVKTNGPRVDYSSPVF